MKLEVRFGVVSNDLDRASEWIETATGLRAEPRESSHWGGDYFAFRGAAGERLRLLRNRDEQDDEPIIDVDPAWRLVLLITDAQQESPVLRALDSIPEKLVKLKTVRY